MKFLRSPPSESELGLKREMFTFFLSLQTTGKIAVVADPSSQNVLLNISWNEKMLLSIGTWDREGIMLADLLSS